jgi:hypothetical protein
MSIRKAATGASLALLAAFGSIAVFGCNKNEADPNEAQKIAEQPTKNPDVKGDTTKETVDSPKNIKRAGVTGGAGATAPATAPDASGAGK